MSSSSLPIPVHTLDATIIDITGQEVPLDFQVPVSVSESKQLVAPTTSYTPIYYGCDTPRLGKQYRYKLGLKAQEVRWLNKVWPPHNVFIAIQGCRIATIRLYLQAVPALEATLRRNSLSLAQVVAQSQEEGSERRRLAPDPFGWSENDDHYLRHQTEATIYSNIFRRCENVVREVYGNKRKLATSFYGLDEAVMQALEQQIGQPLEALLPSLVTTIQAPDEATERELNLQNTARWKQQLDQLVAQLTASTTPEFVEGVNRLGKRNDRNPYVENIFFEASKVMAKYDREEALRFYLQYVYHDLCSTTINSKPLAKTIQKSLFPQPEHLQRFEAVVSQLVNDKNLPQALSQVPTVYERQRRKIELDLGAIREVRHQHAGTVELLNEYLQDEPELAGSTLFANAEKSATLPSAEALPEEEIQLTALDPLPVVSTTTGSTWGLSTIQSALLARFAAQGLTLPQVEVEAFARQHGALRNQLIDSINEHCYERLDDVLIEEDSDTYTIYESYYQQLQTSC